ncbi:MAG: methyltransferase domain-containing protein [Parcubacteria group bacterium]|nr:MAG: methyltransferase domain-containing protein [Parcubacteria group bacterium]
MSTGINNNSEKYSIEAFVEKFSFDETVFKLLKFIESDDEKVKDLIIKKYLRVPISEEEEEEVLDYFINNSVFAAATVANPATSVVTEFLYGEPKAPLPLDQYFFKSKGGKAIKSRLARVEENLYTLAEGYLKKGNVLIGNLGGGPGRDVIDVFSKYYTGNKNIKAINVDKDKNAIKRGKKMADAVGVLDKIEFSEANFMKYNPREKFDIIILVGVLCSLPAETCTLVLKKIQRLLAKGGCIMASNVSPKMLKEDHFTYFVMEKITNWKLVFKEEDVLKDIFAKAGLEWQRSFTDDYGFHCVGIGTKKSFFL